MENDITRKEFIEHFLPEKKTIQTVFKILNYGICVFITFTVLRILFELPILVLALLGAVALTFLSIGYLISTYKKQKKKLEERNSLRVLSALDAIEKTISIASYMTLGAIMYRTWLREPMEAYVIIGVFLIFTLKDK